MTRLVVHMIGNAHLDPVWLWQWPAGVDEALATCRTACDFLDEYDDFVVTRGEAWVHKQIQTIDPRLFERIKAYAGQGRWAVVNGWWIQPDCNLPTAASFRKHAELGGRWFRENMGLETTVGYNVDSFGHNAMMPTFLREAGMDGYCFMRPGAHERELPASLFCWRSVAGDEVTAFRIARAYTCWSIDDLQASLDQAISGANRQVGHTMCFYGVGDHGGGPTRAQIEWIREHRDYAPGVELKFSHPRAFFDATAASGAGLPLVTGELQMHAVGCYSVNHDLKVRMRRAEETLAQADRLPVESDDGAGRRQLDEAWEHVLFNQFHDILAGSSIKPAYDDARDQLGFAMTVASEAIVSATRKAVAALPASSFQRLVLFNLSGRPSTGLVEFEPWLGWRRDLPLRLVDEKGADVPAQPITAEAAVGGLTRLLFKADVPAMGRSIVEIRHDYAAEFASTVAACADRLENEHTICELSANGIGAILSKASGASLVGADGIRVEAFEDTSDTWSHSIDRFSGPSVGIFRETQAWRVCEAGPLRVSTAKRLSLDSSSLEWKVMLDAGDPLVRLRLRMHWQGAHKVVKLLIPVAFAARRTDGCPGGGVERGLDGREYPFYNYAVLDGGASGLAVVSADVFALDVAADGLIRLTLLRSPAYAHHDPFMLPADHLYPITDQGVSEYDISLVPMSGLSMDTVSDEADRQTRPIWIAEATHGVSRA